MNAVMMLIYFFVIIVIIIGTTTTIHRVLPSGGFDFIIGGFERPEDAPGERGASTESMMPPVLIKLR